jgi:quercetin dioxygenase-like cupin family protein
MKSSTKASRMDRPAALADLVAYQAGSVVSQTLVKARTGTVTVFAFDAGEGLSEHEAPFDALLFVVEGRATVRIGGEDHAMSGGQIVRLPAGVPHAVQAVDRFKMLLIMIRDDEPRSS